MSKFQVFVSGKLVNFRIDILKNLSFGKTGWK